MAMPVDWFPIPRCSGDEVDRSTGVRGSKVRQSLIPLPSVAASIRSSQTEKPTPGIGVGAEQGQQPVVAAAADQRASLGFRGAVAGADLEDEAGVVVERAAEGGVVGDTIARQAVPGDGFGAGREQVERRAQRNAGRRREARQRLGCAR